VVTPPSAPPKPVAPTGIGAAAIPVVIAGAAAAIPKPVLPGSTPAPASNIPLPPNALKPPGTPVVPGTGGMKPAVPVSPAPVSAIKPPGATPTPGVNPISPIKPITPGGINPISPIKPVLPGAVSPVTPVAPGGTLPPKPAAAVPMAPKETGAKSGTSVIKTAPPKETARITVKPSLPTATARPANPVVKAAEPGAIPAVAVAAGAAAAVATVKAAEAKPKTPVAVAASPVQFQETEANRSTLLFTVMAGVLAVLTWGLAGLLCYYSLSS
jgi:hypothetical protein